MPADGSFSVRPSAISSLRGVLVGVLVLNALWLGRGIIDPGFRNLDVAGIVYNARLLLEGKLPYLDSAEVKPPGAFLVIAPALAVAGLRGVWALGVLWGALTSLAAGALARICYGDRWGRRVALLHAAASFVANDADINYSFWMALPFTLSAVFAAHSLSARRSWPFAGSWAAAGALALFAVSIKPSASPLLGLFAALWLRELWLRRFSRALLLPVWGASGALLAALVLALPYIAHGRLDALASGIAAARIFGREYVGLVVAGAGGYWNAAGIGMPCLPNQMPAMIGLAALGCLPGGRSASFRFVDVVPWMFLAASLLGVTLTLRFFSHDNAQLWPALSVIALRPNGVVARLFEACESRPWPRFTRALPLGLGLLAAAPGIWERFWLHYYFVRNDHAVAGLCRRFEDVLAPNDTVLAWGWQAWGVYEHCGRPAPGPVYKTLGSVTTLNTNTCNRGYGAITLRKEPITKRFMADLERHPPALILWSSYHVDMGGDPLDEWAELSTFIEQNYVVAGVEDKLIAYVKSDHMESRVAPTLPGGSVGPDGSLSVR